MTSTFPQACDALRLPGRFAPQLINPFFFDLYASWQDVLDKLAASDWCHLSWPQYFSTHIVVTGFVSHWTVNALAFTHSRTPIIGIHAGAPAFLRLVFFTVLSHPETAPSVGNPALESGPRSGWDCDSATLAEWQDGNPFVRFPEAFYVGPVCPTRSLYAEMLQRDAIAYLWFHERGHLNHLHLQFLACEYPGFASIQEVEVPIQGVPMRVWHSLETDADSNAARSYLVGTLTLDHYRQEPTRFRDRCRVWFTAVAMVLLSFEHARLPKPMESRAKHPHPVSRLLSIAIYVGQNVSHIGDWAQAEVLNGWRDAVPDIYEFSYVMQLPGFEFFRNPIELGRNNPFLQDAVRLLEEAHDLRTAISEQFAL